jgi:hypothetical protein
MTRVLDPLADPRWGDLVLRHPAASVFHTPQWLEALRRTYGFRPVVYATDGGADVSGGIPFCEVASWLTGRRLVSLPFSDHCEPLMSEGGKIETILAALEQDSRRNGWRYVQLRPRDPGTLPAVERTAFGPEETQYHYRLDITADLDAVFRGVKSDIRKDVRRAERSGLQYVVGHDDALVAAYFRLHVMTRSTQGVPPQPLSWFHALASSLGDMLDIHLLIDDGTPIAGLVTIMFRDQLMWKYSASHPVRDRAGMGKSLMWKSICRGKERGARSLDMGRCDPANVGLAQFKERWGATRFDLTYLRCPPAEPARARSGGWLGGAARTVVPKLPTAVLAAAGRFAYRHVA